MKWHFSPQLPDQVESEITQRDHFNNDEVDISDTVVREAVQNSLDAAIDDPAAVRVSFRWIGLEDGLTAEFAQQLLEGQLDHARAAELDIDNIDFSDPKALVIEDFGTSGLTGKIDEIDDDNFSDFWRRHGKSHKQGKSRGRWGLGKLVYSTASQVGVFFGVTCRSDENQSQLMGQTVLNLREVDGIKYPPHGYFADLINEDELLRRLPIPVRDKALIERFEREFCLERNGKSGLSVVSLFPDSQFDKDRMIGIAIGNYFYPIITTQLHLKFDDTEINPQNIRELAKLHAEEHFDQIDLLFDFIEDVYMEDEDSLPRLNSSWSDDSKLDEDDFSTELLEDLKEKFTNGELIGLSLPLEVTRKDGTRHNSKFSIYLKRPEGLVKGRDLYVRGGLTVPEEAKFKERKALGLMVAEDIHICGMLGDAENAAHTRWTTNTEKLKRNYRNPQRLLTSIKKSLVNLYDLLVDEIEETDEQALQDFFWYEEEQAGKKKRPKGPNPPVPNPEPRPALFAVNRIGGGFSVHPTEHLQKGDSLPIILNLQVAYDVARGNPYKKYSSHDFRLGKNGNINVIAQLDKSKILSQRENRISVLIADPEFKLECSGFDVNRDLKVRLTTERT